MSQPYCNCIKERKTILEKHAKKKFGDNIDIKDTYFESSLMAFGDNVLSPIIMIGKATCELRRTKTNGESYKRDSMESGNFSIESCPFCGRAYYKSPIAVGDVVTIRENCLFSTLYRDAYKVLNVECGEKASGWNYAILEGINHPLELKHLVGSVKKNAE